MTSKQTRCITAYDASPMMIVRTEYLAICNGRACAAALLNYFEHWMNTKLAKGDRDLWVSVSQKDLPRELMDVFTLTQIKTDLAWLREMDYLQTKHNDAKPMDRQIRYMLNIDTVQAAVDDWLYSTNALVKDEQRIDGDEPMQQSDTDNALVGSGESIGSQRPMISIDSLLDSLPDSRENHARARENDAFEENDFAFPSPLQLDLWQAILAQLSAQLDPATFDTNLRGAALVAVETPLSPLPPSPQTWTIAVRSSYARDACEGKLHKTITRIVNDCAGNGSRINLHYIVQSQDLRQPEQAKGFR